MPGKKSDQQRFDEAKALLSAAQEYDAKFVFGTKEDKQEYDRVKQEALWKPAKNAIKRLGLISFASLENAETLEDARRSEAV